MSINFSESIIEKTLSHPCYSGGCKNARMHLPVAPACNISCNYCNRKFDCVNESRPGVTSEVLTPEQALDKFLLVKSKLSNLKVVGIAGPGDALANFKQTKRTLELIRQADPEITFCLSTNGLYLPRYIDELVALGVTHITVTINTLDPETGADIYKEVTFEGNKYTGIEGATILLYNQLEGLKLAVEAGLVVKVNTVLIKGVNDRDIEPMMKELSAYGIFIGNIMQLIPAPGSVFEHMQLTTKKELNEVRQACGAYIRQMYHCQQCRADAIGALGEDCSAEFRSCKPEQDAPVQPAAEVKHRIAVATSDDRLVNQHFGHAERFSIFDFVNGTVVLHEKREVEKFCGGSAECEELEMKMQGMVKIFADCDIILCSRIGDEPLKLLESNGKKVYQVYGFIDEEIIRLAKGSD